MPSIGGYELTRRLGVGGMGEVWVGQRNALGGAAKTVAVKLMSKERSRDPNARKMFIDEARLSMLLANSNIVQVFDVGETQDGTCFMVMEMVDGLDLAELTDALRASGEKLPPNVAAYIIGEILKGLAYAHDLHHDGQQKTIVHRDISPHNVMVSRSGEIKIMDFGIARMASEETSGVHVKGKLRYMPPEQLRGESREPTLDLFAVGAILHELLDGSKFRSAVVDEARLYGMILDGDIPALLCPQDQVPPELDALRLSLLQAKPEQRIRSARAAYKLLVSWAGYRDARFELEEFIANHMRSVPRDGVTSTGTPARPAFGDGSGSEQRTAILMTDGSQTDLARSPMGATTAIDARETSPASNLPSHPPSNSPSNNRARLISVLLAVGGVSFGLFGAGATFGWWSDDDEPVAANDAPDEAPNDAPTATPPASGPADVEPPAAPSDAAASDAADPQVVAPTPEAVPPVEPAPAPEPEPEPEPESAPEPDETEDAATPETAKASTVKTTISAPGYKFWVEIKIGGRKFAIDRLNSSSVVARFKAGSYSVSFRDKADGAWASAGRITIPNRSSVNVKLLAGGQVAVE